MNTRENILTIALQYDSYGEKYLTDFDRMFIHKELSSIWNETSYVIPEEVENKIQVKMRIINQLQWESPY
ncbi:hypothetical protein SAMN05443633_107167 [Chryseobacterium arachidis]|uniref:Uncharacterized protein n=1 Tax=Chryseobacterium arachidis TaxID=1416778 RepID=A0A1M5F691_9FLAO|nr:hypothetical protein [Chryseobacterium arachidis]SHF86612.1 hypothetical protein SAMN05443633_107167 [Chryseobacterium arachidis]